MRILLALLLAAPTWAAALAPDPGRLEPSTGVAPPEAPDADRVHGGLAAPKALDLGAELAASLRARGFHTELRATYPAADTTHEARVREIRLRFSTAVQLALSTVTVVGPQGVLRDVDSLRYVPGSDEAELRLPLPGTLATGDYTVEWRTAGPDGHPIRGDFGFRVVWTPSAADSAAAPPRPDAATGAAQDTTAGTDSAALAQDTVAGALTPITTAGDAEGGAAGAGSIPAAAVRWLLYAAMAAALGGGAFRVFVLARMARSPDLGPAVEGARRRLSTLTWAAVIASVAALPTLFAIQAVHVFGEGGLAPGNLARLLGSAWGGAWSLQAIAVGVLVLGLVLAHRDVRRVGWSVVAAGGFVLALGAAMGGHARAEGGWLPVAIQTVHAVAASVWTGGVATLALAAVPAGRREPASLARFVSAFSPVALGAVVVLLLTGVANAWGRVGGLGGVFGSDYGRVLLLKLALVVAAGAFGLHNRRTVRPALEENPRIGLIRMPATMEMVVQALVLLATAFLVAIPPPGL